MADATKQRAVGSLSSGTSASARRYAGEPKFRRVLMLRLVGCVVLAGIGIVLLLFFGLLGAIF